MMERDIAKKSRGIFCARRAARYVWIFSMKGRWPITLMCEVMQVSASGYFRWDACTRRTGTVLAGDTRRRLADPHPSHPRVVGRRVRLAAHAPRTADPRPARGQGAGAPIDAAPRYPGQGQARVRGNHRQRTPLASGPGPGAAPLHAGSAQRGVERRHHVHRHRRGLAVPGCRAGPAQPAGCGLEPAGAHADFAGQGCAADSLLSAQTGRRPDFSQRQGSQYCSQDFQDTLLVWGIRSSMSRKGSCWDTLPLRACGDG